MVRKPPVSQSTALLLLALIIAFLAAWPLIGQPGLLNTRGGGDSPFLLQRLQQLETALRDGHFPVRWMPDAYYGFGYPFYNFYAPLSIYIAALFRFLGFSIVRSIELAQLAGFLVAAWGMFLLARRLLGGPLPAFLASIAYTVAPFHMVNIYVRGDSLAEFWAMAWYPWVLLAAEHLFEHRGSRFPYGAVTGLALTYAALILSHNISALIFTPFLLLFIILRRLWPKVHSRSDAAPRAGGKARPMWWTAVALLLALGLSAWFFIPALAEQDLAQLEPVTAGYFHYSNHFRGVELIQPSLIFDYAVAGDNAFRMGLVQGLAALMGTAALLYATLGKRLVAPVIAAFIILSLLVSTLMIMPLSRLLWDSLPLLPFTQFPWRFLSVQAFFAALATGALGLIPWHRLWVPLAAFLLIAAAFLGLRTDHLILTDQDISAEHLAWYEWFTGNIGSTVSAEYLPPTVQPRAYNSSWLNQVESNQPRALSGELSAVRLIQKKTAQQQWLITTGGNGATIMFPTLQWPGWAAEINQEAAEIVPAAGSGLMTLELPAGEHLVTLRLTRTPVRRTAELISLAALVLLLFLLLRAARRPQLGRTFWLTAVLLLAFLLIFRFWPQKTGSAQDLTWDFAQMGYLHHDVSGVSFENGLVLEGYDYDRERVLSGESLNITLIFSGAAGQEVTVSLATPADAWPRFDPQPPDFAAETKQISGETTRFELILPPHVPQGLAIPKITMPDGQPLTASGKRRGDLYLRPLLIEGMNAALEQPGDLDVQALNIIQPGPETLDVQLGWQTGRPISQNYNASLRLIDQEGNWLAQMDAQPGYGFLPSSMWPVGQVVNDWLSLGLPDEMPEGEVLALVANLYDLATGDTVLARRLAQARVQDGKLAFQAHEPTSTLPTDLTATQAVFGDSIKLEGYDLRESANSLELTLYWRALSDGQEDYTRFVHLFDAETGEILAQVDSFPQYNSYPTSQWLVDEVVADPIVFELEQDLPGTFELGVGFYRLEGGNLLRLTAVDEETAVPFADDRVPLIGR